MMRVLRTLALGAILLPALTALAPPAAAKGLYFYDFEETLEPWGVYAETGGYNLERQMGDGGCGYLDGIWHAELEFTPNHSEAVWMIAKFPASGRDLVIVDWAAADAQNCAACQPIAYVGTAFPAHLGVFTKVGAPLNGGWQQYSYQSAPDPSGIVPVASDDMIYVALGWMAPRHNLHVASIAGFDCITVRVMPGP
jgi:hypothetical protein